MNDLLDKLKDLFSKSFIISSFLPVLVCAAINASLLYETSQRFRTFVRSQQPTESIPAILQTGAVFFALAVIANLLSPSITFFREVLEGEHWLSIFNPIRKAMVAFHSQRLYGCEEHTRKMQHELNLLDAPAGPAKVKTEEFWHTQLQTAATTGAATTASAYQPPAKGALNDALLLQYTGALVHFATLDAAKNELVSELRSAAPATNPSLQNRWNQFISLLGYARKRLDAEVIDSIEKRQRKWGETGVAPTDLGNLANATASYGLLRYGFSLEFGLSRLQKVIRKEDPQLQALQDVKANYDAVVTLFWLLALTTFGWAAYLVTQVMLGLFLLVVIAGAVACELLYRTAVSSAVAFGDLLRSCVDLYRFDLLRALHLPLPAGLNEERTAWNRVRKQVEFGETADLRYKHPEGDGA